MFLIDGPWFVALTVLGLWTCAPMLVRLIWQGLRARDHAIPLRYAFMTPSAELVEREASLAYSRAISHRAAGVVFVFSHRMTMRLAAMLQRWAMRLVWPLWLPSMVAELRRVRRADLDGDLS